MRELRFARLGFIAGMLLTGNAIAGGGVVMSDDTCIITIGFYTAHFTAYQPGSSGNKQFCEDLPNTGETIFVLEYLHGSLKEVPVDFRIIRNVTGHGRFAGVEDIDALEDLEEQTIFYRAAEIRPDSTFNVEHEFAEEGAYIGIVTAGHPTNDNLYTAVFPFEVGVTEFPYWLPIPVIAALAVIVYFLRGRRRKRRRAGPVAGGGRP